MHYPDRKFTRPLVTVMIAQGNTFSDKGQQQTLICEEKLEKVQELQERSKQIEEALPISTRQVIKQTKMVAAPDWLNTIPLAKHEFSSTKGEFRDAF